MTDYEVLSLVLGVLTLVLIPLLVLVVKGAVRWARMEDKMIDLASRMDLKIGGLAEDIKSLVDDKDKVHSLIYQQMREDRVATNKRLIWLEQNLWKRG